MGVPTIVECRTSHSPALVVYPMASLWCANDAEVYGTMSKESLTPDQLVERLLRWLPPAPTPEVWEAYRLERVASTPGPLLRELLSLTLFWMKSALDAHYAGIAEILVWPRLLDAVRAQWQAVYGLAEPEWDAFLAELPARMAEYNRVKADGGSAVSVSTQAGAYLEEQWVIRSEEQPALLAFIVDHIATDAIGEIFEESELVPPSS